MESACSREFIDGRGLADYCEESLSSPKMALPFVTFAQVFLTGKV